MSEGSFLARAFNFALPPLVAGAICAWIGSSLQYDKMIGSQESHEIYSDSSMTEKAKVTDITFKTDFQLSNWNIKGNFIYRTVDAPGFKNDFVGFLWDGNNGQNVILQDGSVMYHNNVKGKEFYSKEFYGDVTTSPEETIPQHQTQYFRENHDVKIIGKKGEFNFNSK